MVGDCSGLYVSTGERYATVPAQQYARTTWVTVERGSPFAHNFSVRFSAASEATYQELVSSGSDAISVSSRPSSINGKVSVLFVVTRAHGSMTSVQVPVAIGSTHAVEVVTDTAKHLEQVTMDGVLFIDNPLTNYGQIENHVPEGVTVMPEGPLTVTHVPLFGSDSAICRKLIG